MAAAQPAKSRRRARPKQTPKNVNNVTPIRAGIALEHASDEDDALRTREYLLFVRCLFGQPGLQIRDYAGTLSPVATAKGREAQNGTARTVHAA